MLKSLVILIIDDLKANYRKDNFLIPAWDAIACLRILNKIVFHKKMCFSKLEYIYTKGSKWFNKWGRERQS